MLTLVLHAGPWLRGGAMALMHVPVTSAAPAAPLGAPAAAAAAKPAPSKGAGNSSGKALSNVRRARSWLACTAAGVQFLVRAEWLSEHERKLSVQNGYFTRTACVLAYAYAYRMPALTANPAGAGAGSAMPSPGTALAVELDPAAVPGAAFVRAYRLEQAFHSAVNTLIQQPLPDARPAAADGGAAAGAAGGRLRVRTVNASLSADAILTAIRLDLAAP